MHKPTGDNLIGTIVENRFEILSRLGEGGMATVYKAEHREMDQMVAIKVLKRHAEFNKSDIERLKREARALKTLFHPNIVKAHSFGFLSTGEPYIVLDYLHGKSLEDIISTGQLPPIKWTVEVFIQICRGLECAHSNGLIHRDLKPSNVMIIDETVCDAEHDGAFVKLLDFGTAKSSAPKKNEMALTQKGVIFGSPFYISPEQIAGKEFDIRTDIYSFGCLMYEIITGVPPYIGETDMDTLMKHLHAQAYPFYRVVPDTELPEGLEEIIFRCIDKEPDNRFQTAAELEKALKACLKDCK